MKSRISAVLKQINTLFFAYLLILMACLFIKLEFSRAQIFFTVNSWHFAAGDVLAVYFTDMGDGLFIIALSVLLAFFNFRTSFLLFSSYLLTSLFAQVIKHANNAPRPTLYFKDQLSHIYLVKGVEIFSINSFPSGHTVSIFSAAVVFTYLVSKKTWGFLFLLWAILVGYSRMYLCEHFFEDVLGGSMIGFLVTVLWLAYIDSLPFLQRKGWHLGLIDLLRRK